MTFLSTLLILSYKEGKKVYTAQEIYDLCKQALDSGDSIKKQGFGDVRRELNVYKTLILGLLEGVSEEVEADYELPDDLQYESNEFDEVPF